MEVDAEKVIDTIRLRSIAEGKLFDVQILNLKAIPLVIFGEDLTNTFQIDFEARKIHFELTGITTVPSVQFKERLGFLIQSVRKIIGNFEVTVLLNKKNLNGPDSSTRKVRKKSNIKRKKRLRKVRKGK